MPSALPPWQLVWHDEFDGPGIDPAKWEHEVNAWGGGNNELQYYTARPENSWIADSCLHLCARREQYTGPEGTRDYTSARLRTKQRGDWRYGKFELRAQLPFGQGIWPALWMLPTHDHYGTWAASGEIDIVELVGQRPNELLAYLHYGGRYPDNEQSGSIYRRPEGDFVSAFHVFGVEWEEGEIRWYVDGVCYARQAQWRSEAAPYPAPFDQPFHLVLNVAVGGRLPGDPSAATAFPQTMRLDWVRIYQRVSL